MLRLEGHAGQVRALAFSPDGRWLATVAGHERVSLWELPAGKRTFAPGLATATRGLAFTPDSSAVVVASDNYLRRWDIAAGRIEEKWLRTSSYCQRLASSPDGSLLAAACSFGFPFDCRVNLFRIDALPRKTSFGGNYGTPHCLAFSPDGRFLALGGRDKAVKVWSLKDKARLVTWKCPMTARAVAFSPAGPVAVVAAGRALAVFDTTTHRPRGELAKCEATVNSLCFTPDGTLLSAGDDGVVRSWDVAAGREQGAFDWKVGAIRVAACSRDGMLAAVGGASGLVVWDLE